jgi:hypothetical protein
MKKLINIINTDNEPNIIEQIIDEKINRHTKRNRARLKNTCSKARQRP